MKAYGVKRKDHSCCPGHDKYPAGRYNHDRGLSRKREQRGRKKSERMAVARWLRQEVLLWQFQRMS